MTNAVLMAVLSTPFSFYSREFSSFNSFFFFALFIVGDHLRISLSLSKFLFPLKSKDLYSNFRVMLEDRINSSIKIVKSFPKWSPFYCLKAIELQIGNAFNLNHWHCGPPESAIHSFQQSYSTLFLLRHVNWLISLSKSIYFFCFVLK